MEVSSNSSGKNKLVESLLNKDFASFSKYLQESVEVTENLLVRKYSNKIKEELNA
jgi:hypothetical protein